MSGETDLDVLIQSMSADLKEPVFVFASFAPGKEIPDVPQVMRFGEVEGETLILRLSDAEQAGIAYEYPCRMITLNIHSALEAIGFLARITTALAARGISVNPVSAFYHDHLFVPVDKADLAMEILQALARGEE